METTKTIQMLPVAELKAHPQNPRRDLGDLTELAGSIRENGVLQNLTVVPWLGEVTGQPTGDYKVIIGHRRLAAAKQAGLTEVPCVVTMMTPAEQVKTMLMENMQRSDLTPLEQADGFQMMLDLGVTLDEVVQESGFSESTVRRRLKLRELDRQTLEDKLTQGATLMDLIKLEQLTDEKARNKVLATIGTNNFEYVLNQALAEQQRKLNKPLWIELLNSFAQQIPSEENNSRKWEYMGWHSFAEDPQAFTIPGDAQTETYGYTLESGNFTLRRQRAEGEQKEDKEEDKEKSELELQVENMEQALEESSIAAYQLRLAFIQGHNLKKKSIPDALHFLMSSLGMGQSVDSGALRNILGVPRDLKWQEQGEARKEAFTKLLATDPDKALLFLAYATSWDSKGAGYFDTSWRTDRFPLFSDNEKLNRLYDFLELLGYQISDEERLLMSGEHPAFQPGKEQQAENPDEEDEEEDDDD